MDYFRPSKDEYYWNIAKAVAERTTCMSVKGGALIVRDDQIISAGYVGAPRNTKNCFEIKTCLRRELNVPSGQRYELCRSVHAEQNAIINSARSGSSLLGGTMYLYFAKRTENGEKFVLAYPCFICKKMIINAGLNRFVGNDESGKLVSYNIADWAKDWQDHDMLYDSIKYDSKYDTNVVK
ncbi:MAG: dCMP deaminase family protein [Candidatus ainarchaeum sp.]|nr:dCMP deaminase family protein [Candidatus ainarchaeum sp.]